MTSLTEENVQWLSLLVEQASEKTTDNVKKVKLKSLLEKVNLLGKHELKVTITSAQIKAIDEVLKDLEEITSEYTNAMDITDLEVYDKIKKKFTAKLEFLSTYKVLFNEEINYLEDVLKKEIRVHITMEIKDEEGISFTQADKMVEKDIRYTRLRDHIYNLKMISTKIKTKYEFYSQLWQMVFQSVSTASKEKYARSSE